MIEWLVVLIWIALIGGQVIAQIVEIRQRRKLSCEMKKLEQMLDCDHQRLNCVVEAINLQQELIKNDKHRIERIISAINAERN
jgi:hypothetical protein